jgi:hypothetical protein
VSPDERSGPWERELDDMEAYLETEREAFIRRAGGGSTRGARSVEELGPLPDRLRARAEALLSATRAFEGEVRDARASLAGLSRHAERPVRKVAAYVDARA